MSQATKERQYTKPEVLKSLEGLYFPVKMEPLVTTSGLSTSSVALVREDTQKVIGTASEMYKIIPNKTAFDSLFEALNKSKQPWEVKRVAVTRGGARCFVTVDLPKVRTNVAVGDVVGLRGVFVNSYDRSRLFHMSLGSVRLVCMNGAVASDRKLINLTRKHVGDVTDVFGAMEGVTRAIDSFDKVVASWSRMTKLFLTKNEGAKLVLDSAKQCGLREKWQVASQDAWSRQYNTPRVPANLWGALNAITEVLTHQVTNPETQLKWGARVDSHFRKLSAAAKLN